MKSWQTLEKSAEKSGCNICSRSSIHTIEETGHAPAFCREAKKNNCLKNILLVSNRKASLFSVRVEPSHKVKK